MSQFVDEAIVTFTSGKGGNGAASFHREKHVPRGGPNGSDGGRGGDITLVARRNKRTLYDFQLKNSFKAADALNAYLNKRGKDGEPILIELPIGTLVTDMETGDLVADLSLDGMSYVIARGGRGGLGNLHFTNSVRQAPTFAQNGAPAESITVKLELKLLADVGVIGMPNAGKSTLLSQMSAARPKIADYPFTTLSPNLGVVYIANETFVMADLPGLIEGASEGIGLGHQFLKHAERTKVLLHVVDAFPIDETDPFENYLLIENELKLYNEDLYLKPRIVVLNKSDIGDTSEVEAAFAGIDFPVLVISAVASKGIEPLGYLLLKTVEKESEKEEFQTFVPVIRAKEEGSWDAEKVGSHYQVNGKRVERLVSMTRMENRDAVHFLHRKLQRIGIIEKLKELGCVPGDTVKIGHWEFTFSEW